MSEENVQIVRRVYDAVPALPIGQVRELYDETDYVMDLSDIAPDVGVIRGLDAADQAIRPYYETFEEFEAEIDEVIYAGGDVVVTAAHDGGRLRGSGAAVRNHRFHVWTLRDGTVIRFSGYTDRGRALEAAGLSE